jgi:hypothetical protein
MGYVGHHGISERGAVGIDASSVPNSTNRRQGNGIYQTSSAAG